VGKVPGKLLAWVFSLSRRFEVVILNSLGNYYCNSLSCFTGLLDLRAGSPIELTAPMAKGFDMGVVVLLDYVESLATFFTHPSHDEYVHGVPFSTPCCIHPSWKEQLLRKMGSGASGRREVGANSYTL